MNIKYFFFPIFQCWNSCSSIVSGPLETSNTSSTQLDAIKLSVHSLVRDRSLTSADITWISTNDPSQCLVTWEVAGGGLMGNLLTDTPDAQLSLWPDTKYRVQVTCKNKVRSKFTFFLLYYFVAFKTYEYMHSESSYI